MTLWISLSFHRDSERSHFISSYLSFPYILFYIEQKPLFSLHLSLLSIRFSVINNNIVPLAKQGHDIDGCFDPTFLSLSLSLSYKTQFPFLGGRRGAKKSHCSRLHGHITLYILKICKRTTARPFLFWVHRGRRIAAKWTLETIYTYKWNAKINMI
ncbi:hypothetical protein LZ30DRAFT_103856 [Colletotrichum cereale]|nr:hypothetical protein LZ30DRAFT_103856 [Colletotrichum cereale]